MADKKISDLALTPAINLDDTYEKSRHNAAPSERVTQQQIVTFFQTAMALVTLSGGKISLNADGSASFVTGAIVLNTSGQVVAGKAGLAGAVVVNDVAGNQTTILNGDGSASLATGATTISDLGLLDTKDLTINGAVIQLNQSGSASFANGNVLVTASASLSIGGTVDGAIALFDSGGNGTISMTGLDGGATFAAAQITLAADGSIDTATAYKCQSVQVVGAQQPAIADATSTLDVVARVNDILAMLRVHGLIAV